MAEKDCVDHVLGIKYKPYTPADRPMACTFKAAQRLVAIRDEVIAKDSSGDQQPRSLADALGVVLQVRQKTTNKDNFATNSDEFY